MAVVYSSFNFCPEDQHSEARRSSGEWARGELFVFSVSERLMRGTDPESLHS